jgi:DDE superfamily endonuclease
LTPERLVFIDETWATTAMARRYGRARRGTRVVGAVPHGHWKTTTLIAALRTDGLTAPCVFDGAINGARFLAYVEQALAPTLRPGDIVVMDNLGAHKVKCVRQVIEAAGAELLFAALQSGPEPDRAGVRQAQGPAQPPPPAPSTHSGGRSAMSSTPSPQPNAPTISPTPAMFHLTGKRSRAIRNRAVLGPRLSFDRHSYALAARWSVWVVGVKALTFSWTTGLTAAQ